jgi:hypothetical protein
LLHTCYQSRVRDPITHRRSHRIVPLGIHSVALTTNGRTKNRTDVFRSGAGHLGDYRSDHVFHEPFPSAVCDAEHGRPVASMTMKTDDGAVGTQGHQADVLLIGYQRIDIGEGVRSCHPRHVSAVRRRNEGQPLLRLQSRCQVPSIGLHRIFVVTDMISEISRSEVTNAAPTIGT